MSKPIYPLLVHFSIALLLTSLASDAAYFVTSLQSLPHAGFWMLAAACASGALTVLAGLCDMRRAALKEEVHERVRLHMWVGIALYAAIAALTLWPWMLYSDPVTEVSVLYLDAAFLVSALAVFQGWLVGKLVYSHGGALEEGGPFQADTVNVGPGQRYDVVWKALKSGTWPVHCHSQHHTTNNNVEHKGGGGLTMILDVAV